MKIELVPWLLKVKGKSGNTVFRKYKDETIIAKTPSKRTTPYSPRQLAVQEQFTQASEFADMVLLNPPLLAVYEKAAEKNGKSAYQTAREDWFDAPKVIFTGSSLAGYAGQVGDIIKFTVRDEVPVESVIVTLSDDETGDLIEKGQGVPDVAGTTYWKYTATKPVPAGVTVVIQIEAFDHPGNSGQASASKKIVA